MAFSRSRRLARRRAATSRSTRFSARRERSPSRRNALSSIHGGAFFAFAEHEKSRALSEARPIRGAGQSIRANRHFARAVQRCGVRLAQASLPLHLERKGSELNPARDVSEPGMRWKTSAALQTVQTMDRAVASAERRSRFRRDSFRSIRQEVLRGSPSLYATYLLLSRQAGESQGCKLPPQDTRIGTL